MYAIFLFPTNQDIFPHVWKEGGTFNTFHSAEFQADQIRKGMKKEYKKVLVIPAKLKAELYNSNGEWCLIVRRTFEALNFPKDSEERKKLNESNMTSEYLRGNRWAIVLNNYSSSTRTLSQAKEKAKVFIK